MGKHLRRSWLRLAALIVVIVCLTPAALAPRQTAHAAGTIEIGVINARYGQLHLTGSGLPANHLLYVIITAATIANPNYIVRTYHLETTPTGSFDEDFLLGLFVCGTTLHAEVVDDGAYVYAESIPFNAQCPVTNPMLTVTGVQDGLIGVSGQDFEIEEAVVLTATSLLTSRVSVASAMTDITGAFSVTVPLASIGCGETFAVTALGAAGSAAQSAPFFYNCLPPQPGEPAHAPPPPSGSQSAGAGTSRPHAGQVHGVRLDVFSDPAMVSFHQRETLSVATGLPGVIVMVQLSALGVALARFSVRADAHGNALVIYTVPMHLPAGKRLTVSYTATFANGAVHFRTTGAFVIAGG